MTPEEIRMACLDLAVTMNQSIEDVLPRAAVFLEFVGDDPVKLGCLRAVVKGYGNPGCAEPRGTAEKALGYLQFVRPPPPPPVAQAERKKGRRRRN